MMQEADKNRNIAAQTAAKVVGEILHGTGNIEASVVQEAIKNVYGAIIGLAPIPDDFVVQVSPPQPIPMAQAQQNVVQGFPGATVAPQAPAVIPQTGALHPASTKEEQWRDLLANPGAWYDNRAKGDTTISGGKKPDFRHKQIEDDKGRKLGLFLVSQWGNAPDYVWQHFGMAPPAAAPPAPQQPQQQPIQYQQVPNQPQPQPPPQQWGPDEAPF